MLAALKSTFRKRPQAPPPIESPWSDASLAATLPEIEAWQTAILQSVQHTTMTSPQRVLAFCQAIEHVTRLGLPGAIVECGVWRGGSMAAAARTLLQLGQPDRELWLYDTFEGMSPPTEQDHDFLGREAAVLMAEQSPSQADSIWCRSELDEVQTNLSETGYPTDRIRYVVGPVEETLASQFPTRIAVLRLDTDWYESTRCELETLFPRLVPGGILIVDDYGHWEGCRRAVDEYLERNGIPMFLHRIDYTGRLGVKPHAPSSGCP